MQPSPLLREVETFLAETGLGPHRFGILAIKNGRLVERLRDGRRVWPETEMAIRAYIRSERSLRARVAAE